MFSWFHIHSSNYCSTTPNTQLSTFIHISTDAKLPPRYSEPKWLKATPSMKPYVNAAPCLSWKHPTPPKSSVSSAPSSKESPQRTSTPNWWSTDGRGETTIDGSGDEGIGRGGCAEAETRRRRFSWSRAGTVIVSGVINGVRRRNIYQPALFVFMWKLTCRFSLRFSDTALWIVDFCAGIG